MHALEIAICVQLGFWSVPEATRKKHHFIADTRMHVTLFVK